MFLILIKRFVKSEHMDWIASISSKQSKEFNKMLEFNHDLKLNKIPLGNSGLQISPLGLGTVKFGRNQKVKYPTSFELPNDQQIQELLDLAFHLGINLIDTAPAYGISEERLGQLLLHSRQNWIISTKVGEEFHEGHSYFDFSAQHTERSVLRSLKRLKTDYLDIVMIHSDGNDLNIIEKEDALNKLHELKTKGLIRAIGMSTKTVEGGILALKNSDLAMVTYNREHNHEEPVLDYAQVNNKGIIIKKAFGSGHLCQSTSQPSNTQTQKPEESCLEYVFQHDGVNAAIIGTLNPKHLLANCQAMHNVLTRLSTAKIHDSNQSKPL